MIKQKIVLFDIDYTLFNSLRFRKKILREIRKKITSDNIKNIEESLDKIYLKSRRQVGYFDPSSFVRDVNKKFNAKIPVDFLDSYAKKEELSEHLYKEVEEVLQELAKDKDLTIGIFSGGNIAFQREKIKKLLMFFHKKHMHIFPYKIDELESVLAKYKDYKVFLIDDVLQILYKAKRINKDISTVWVKRGKFTFSEKKVKNLSPDMEAKDLRDIASLILK